MSFCGIGSLLRSTVRPARPMPAELTSTRNGPISEAAATAVAPSSSLDTSHLTKMPPISLATAEPRSSCRSATTIRAPNAASCRADASPMPDAPPVTIAGSAAQVKTRHRHDPLDDRGVGQAAALAHRLQAVAAAGALELVEQRRHQLRARRAERVAERDRAAVDVGLGEVGRRAPCCHASTTEANASLTSNRSMSSSDRPDLCEDLRRRRDRALQHRHRIGAGHGEACGTGRVAASRAPPPSRRS